LARTEEAADERDRQKEWDSAREHKAGRMGRERNSRAGKKILRSTAF